MANPDRPKGFTPVRHINGGSWNNALAERALVNDVAFDEGSWGIGIGTPVQYVDYEDGVGAGSLLPLPSVQPMVDEDASGAGASLLVYGVVVGIGNAAAGDTLNAGETGPWDAALLEGPNYVTTAEIEADPDGYVLYIAPARDWIFEAQTDSAEVLGIGTTMAITAADNTVSQVDTNTGRSTLEVNQTADEVQLRVVGVPEYPDNDIELTNARVHVMFVDAWPVAESQ